MALTYVCSPLSAPTRAEMLANAAKASTYMMKAEQEFGNRAVAPHAYLPFLLDDTAPEERALALEFGQKLLEHYESRGNLAAGKRTADQIILLKDYDPEIIRNFVERVRVYPSGEIEIDMRTSSGFEFVTAS